jgi:hypothetical protein
MSFIFLSLSLIVSVLQEMFASFMQARSAVLERGLRSLFSGDSVGSKLSLVDSVYDHGLIRGLYQDPRKDYADERLADEKQQGIADQEAGKPASQTARKEDTLSRWTSFQLWLRRVTGIATLWQTKVVSDPTLLPSYIPARTFALALIDILNANKTNGQPLGNIKSLLADTLETNPANKAAQALLTLAIDAGDNLGKFQENLENWFNDSMDRVSGWYKRHTQKFLFIIGLLVAIAFNVDSVRVAQTLWIDRDARQGMVTAAGTYIKQHPKPVNQQTGQGAGVATQDHQDTQQNLTDLTASMRNSVKAFHDVANESLLPVGWRHTPRAYLNWFRDDLPAAAKRSVLALLGWFITAAALSLGAPFWFDTLNKFMVVRGTVKPEEKSQTESSKDN